MRAPEPVDPRVELAFVAHSPFRTWNLEIEAPSDAEPTNLYAALAAAGWHNVADRDLHAARKWDRRRKAWAPYMIRVHLFARDSESQFRSAWSEAERITFIRGARTLLHRFGFVAVPMIRRLGKEA